MKKVLFLVLAAAGLSAANLSHDITGEIPEISQSMHGFRKIPDVAQYKEADWSQVIGIARGITLDQAFKLTDENPEITFFFHMKGYQMVLEKPDGSYRVFRHGDTVFFKGEPWWGSAPGFSDGYIRE